MQSPSLMTLAGLGLAATTLAAPGCGRRGDGPPRVPVAGTVRLDGQPLAAGMITFTPTEAAAPVVSAIIGDGAYALPRADGPAPGPHRVSIWAERPTGEKVRDPDDPERLVDRMQDVVPPNDHLDSELGAEVGEQGANALDFDLRSKVAGRPTARRSRRR